MELCRTSHGGPLAGQIGAAALVLMHADEAARRELTPLARIASWATAGVDPAIMGTGPIPAATKALARAGWAAHELDRIEANEAFAAQACTVNRAIRWGLDRVNVNAVPSPWAIPSVRQGRGYW